MSQRRQWINKLIHLSLFQLNWDFIYTYEMDEAYNVFVRTITDCKGVIAPELITKRSNNKVIMEHWYTNFLSIHVVECNINSGLR